MACSSCLVSCLDKNNSMISIRQNKWNPAYFDRFLLWFNVRSLSKNPQKITANNADTGLCHLVLTSVTRAVLKYNLVPKYITNFEDNSACDRRRVNLILLHKEGSYVNINMPLTVTYWLRHQPQNWHQPSTEPQRLLTGNLFKKLCKMQKHWSEGSKWGKKRGQCSNWHLLKGRLDEA